MGSCAGASTTIRPLEPRRLALGSALLAATLSGLGSQSARADQFHYNNVVVGTRAVGLGGAFGAVADDASGLYYNPAGIAFALSNDIQGSANAFYTKQTTYKKTLGDDDFVENSSGSLSPFFGGLQKLDRYVDGLVAAFGIYYVDGDLKDQDTLLENKLVNSVTIERYHRTSNARAGTYYAGAAVGYRPVPKVAFGFGMAYYSSDELVQEYQYARQSVLLPATVNGQSTTISGWRVLNSNVRERLTVYGVQPTLGMQVALPAGVTAGLTLKKGVVASQKLESTSENNATVLTDTQHISLNTQGVVSQPLQASQSISSSKSTKPVGEMPMETRLGLAWFASPTFLWSLDVTNYSAVTSADVGTDPVGVRARYARQAVTNFASGVEWYAAPSFPIRLGAFTNNDARPKVAKSTPNTAAGESCKPGTDFYKNYCAQPDHIDYYGGSLFIAWVQPNSQISAGVVLQSGNGSAQKLGDYQVQDVNSRQYQLAFSATHNL